MKFAIICPTAGLERYATLSDTHLVLAQITDPLYMDFYRKRRVAGDTLILDNGAYENGQSLPEPQFTNAIEFYDPQWIVCPDKLFAHWEETYTMTKSFLDKYGPYCKSGVNFMAIPQTTEGDIISWCEGLLRICEELPIDGIGLPRALVTHYCPGNPPDTRMKACEFIKRRYPHLYVHAFGMANGDLEELDALRAVGCDSADSSAPVWRAWSKCYNLDVYHREQWDKYGSPCDFNAPLPRDLHKLNQIKNNLRRCGVDVTELGQWC